MFTCKECIDRDGGCCVYVLAGGWKIILLPSEIERIAAVSGKAPSEFVDVSPLDPEQIEIYTSRQAAEEDPLWARLFSLWRQPSGIAHACPFLGSDDCTLPYQSKPFICRVFPLNFSISEGRLQRLTESHCSMEQEMTSVQQVLEYFHDDVSKLNGAFDEFRQECLMLMNKMENLNIRPMTAEDRLAVVTILKKTPEFEPPEIPVAEEVIDSYLRAPVDSGYSIYVAELGSKVVGYVCYGWTPLTQGTWDIYWIAVAPSEKGRGIGKALMAHAEAEIGKARGRLILVETSSKPSYERTRNFYRSQGYQLITRIPDFYSPGDDKLTLQKRLR